MTLRDGQEYLGYVQAALEHADVCCHVCLVCTYYRVLFVVLRTHLSLGRGFEVGLSLKQLYRVHAHMDGLHIVRPLAGTPQAWSCRGFVEIEGLGAARRVPRLRRAYLSAEVLAPVAPAPLSAWRGDLIKLIQDEASRGGTSGHPDPTCGQSLVQAREAHRVRLS